MFKDLDQSERWVLLELAQIMVLQVRNCWWMSMDQLSALQKDLQHEFEDREKNGKITGIVNHEFSIRLLIVLAYRR